MVPNQGSAGYVKWLGAFFLTCQRHRVTGMLHCKGRTNTPMQTCPAGTVVGLRCIL
jgi:hypothetical protein